MRVGMGYDVHRLTENRDLILGGVKIPYAKRIVGTFRCGCIAACDYGRASGSSGHGRYWKTFSRHGSGI